MMLVDVCKKPRQGNVLSAPSIYQKSCGGKLAKSRFFQDETRGQNVNNSLSWVWASLVRDDLGTHLGKAYILFKMVVARLWILEELVKYWSLPF